ncbi:hypothetical protein QBC35DRAFT_23515 [Podospora australis]|uniref:Secreted protein n=1 Tax=Podospora australis TaxID=1536484 RepID=A0AAN7AL44_9PEZI|nr:hypothetical protein QBC35DRAFT_23515 [Podospora australis]
MFLIPLSSMSLLHLFQVIWVGYLNLLFADQPPSVQVMSFGQLLIPSPDQDSFLAETFPGCLFSSDFDLPDGRVSPTLLITLYLNTPTRVATPTNSLYFHFCFP